MKKVYAIHTGSIHEGGGVQEIYKDKDNAIKFALMMVVEKNKKVVEIHGEDTDFMFIEISYDFPMGSVIKCWQSCIDEIIIYEYDLK